MTKRRHRKPTPAGLVKLPPPSERGWMGAQLSRVLDFATALRSEDEEIRRGFALLLDFDRDEGDDNGIAAAVTGHSKAFEDAEQAYRVFTTRYDTEVQAGTLVR